MGKTPSRTIRWHAGAWSRLLPVPRLQACYSCVQRQPVVARVACALFGLLALVSLLVHRPASALRLWGRADLQRPSHQLWTLRDNSVELAQDMSEDEAERARKTVVDMLAVLYSRQLLPFKTADYARKKGVFDRVPLERFFDAATQLIGDQQLENCLEWGPYFKRWPNVTQPYMQKFHCQNQWTFSHDASNPRVRTLFGNSLYGELDSSLSAQGLLEVKDKFDLVIIPQTLQYVVDPHFSMKVLFDLVKPGGYLLFTTPFMQTVMPYPTDYFRFTAEGNEKLLAKAGFQVLKSYVGGDDFWSLCWIMHCGVSDLSQQALQAALTERGGEYSHNSYMLSAQIARKPAVLSGL